MLFSLLSLLVVASSPAVVLPAPAPFVSAFGAPVFGIAQLGDGATLLTGGEAGLILARRWQVGLSLLGTPRLGGFERVRAGDEFVSFWQGGAIARYEFGEAAWRVHPRVGVMLGAAYVQVDALLALGRSSFHFAAEPRVGVGIEVTRFFHVGLDVGYRFLAPVPSGLRFDQASGVSGVLTAAFGWF
jgi:hypothetical protein